MGVGASMGVYACAHACSSSHKHLFRAGKGASVRGATELGKTVPTA